MDTDTTMLREEELIGPDVTLKLPDKLNFREKKAGEMHAKGWLLMAIATSYAEVNSIIKLLNELYAGYTIPPESTFNKGRKVCLNVQRLNPEPKSQEAIVFRVLDKLCRSKIQ